MLSELPDFDKDWQEEATKSIRDALLILKPDVSLQEFEAVQNQELRRFIIETHPEFISSVTAATLDENGPNKLLAFNNQTVWLWVKDASTERRYLLQVPSEMKRVRQALAWTFNMEEDDYAPIAEA